MRLNLASMGLSRAISGSRMVNMLASIALVPWPFRWPAAGAAAGMGASRRVCSGGSVMGFGSGSQKTTGSSNCGMSM